jgi:membrane protein
MLRPGNPAPSEQLCQRQGNPKKFLLQAVAALDPKPARTAPSIWDLGGLSVPQLGRRVWTGLNEDDLPGRAAELAFSFVLSLVPLLLFLFSLFGLFASRGTLLAADLMRLLSDILPPSAFEILNQSVAEVSRRNAGGELTFGIVLALFFASGGMSSMMSTLNVAYEVKETRSVIKVRVLALGLTLAVSALVTAALLVVLLGGYIAKLLGRGPHLSAVAIVGWRLVELPITLLFMVIAFSLIYFYGPNLREQRWHMISPGSLFGVTVWIAASFGFRGYLHFFDTYTRTYGSLGAAMILLVWLYVTSLAFLIGGEINAKIEGAQPVAFPQSHDR